MGERSAIEWTDATWTPIRALTVTLESDGTGRARTGWHCEHASEGCRHCYAEAMNRRLGTGLDFKPGNRKLIDLHLDEAMLVRPLRWRKGRRIFVCSMTDLFADFVPDDWIDRMFAVMALCPQHVFQVLTKRPERMRAWFLADRQDAVNAHAGTMMDWSEMPEASWPPPNVWLGTSVEDQKAADARRDALAATPATVRFVSYEPALGPVDWTGWEYLNWMISGGESGREARPSHPDWHRAARDFCAANGTAYLFKQWGNWGETWSAEKDGATHFVTPDGAARLIYSGMRWPEGGVPVRHMDKKRAGRLLDGVLHDGMPA